MNRLRIGLGISCAALLVAAMPARAQPTPDAAAAQQRYEREVGACNSGALPAPAREACIRDAGHALDRARGGPPNDVTVPSADGRATIVAPEGATPPSGGSDTVPSRDGRATIVLPADRAAPR
jgi:hypothetical protein